MPLNPCNTNAQEIAINERASSFLDSIDPFDQYGFQVRPHHYWLPESPEDEINRLEWNLLIYEQFLLNGSIFPDHVNQARLNDFNRLQTLKSRVA